VRSGELQPTRYFREIFAALPQSVRQLLGAQALATGQYTLDFALSVCIAPYLAFFLLRDGNNLMRLLRRAVPLAPQHAQERVDKFGTVIRASVRGNFVVALIQGTLGGLTLWALDVGAVLLWTVLMAFPPLLPALGVALVWACQRLRAQAGRGGDVHRRVAHRHGARARPLKPARAGQRLRSALSTRTALARWRQPSRSPRPASWLQRHVASACAAVWAWWASACRTTCLTAAPRAHSKPSATKPAHSSRPSLARALTLWPLPDAGAGSGCRTVAALITACR